MGLNHHYGQDIRGSIYPLPLPLLVSHGAPPGGHIPHFPIFAFPHFPFLISPFLVLVQPHLIGGVLNQERGNKKWKMGKCGNAEMRKGGQKRGCRGAFDDFTIIIAL